MTRLLIIPAAGSILNRVAGRPLLDHLERLYRRAAAAAVIAAPAEQEAAIRARLSAFGLNAAVVTPPAGTAVVAQILAAAPRVLASNADRIWIADADSVAISAATIARLQELEERDPDAGVIMPVAEVPDPPVHIDRDDTGRVTRVLQREAGDTLPGIGRTDAGLFSLSRRAFLEDLRWFAPEAAGFLPFLIGRRVVAFAIDPAEAAPGIGEPPRVAMIRTGKDLRAQVIRAHVDLIMLADAGLTLDSADQDAMLEVMRSNGADILLGGSTPRSGAALTLCPRALLLNLDLDRAGADLTRAIVERARAAAMPIVRVPIASAPSAGTRDTPKGLSGWVRALRARWRA